MSQQHIKKLKQTEGIEERLLIFRKLTTTNIFKAYKELVELLVKDDQGFATADSDIKKEILRQYYYVCSLLIIHGEENNGSVSGDAWQNYLMNYILEDRNVFTRKAENMPLTEIGESLKGAVVSDLCYLQKLYRVDNNILKTVIKDKLQEQVNGKLPDWNKITDKEKGWNIDKIELKNKMKQENWGSLLAPLADFYRKSGTGMFNVFKAFRWQQNGVSSGLQGISYIDGITLDNLIGYQYQQQQLKNNTKKLLEGYRANNILLYGDRGTGKSSTVKAMVNEYWDQGLRLVELAKGDIYDFPDILDHLSRRNLKFILFLDDLSFDENEGEYRDLKALLEGRVQPLPDNVVIYATSNRRHLIKEKFSDREVGSGNEIRRQDTVQEKLSLADRFGMYIIFTTPDQTEYLKIVWELARQEGIDIKDELLEKKALQWEKRQNGRSGRTARQFVDYLKSERAQ